MEIHTGFSEHALEFSKNIGTQRIEKEKAELVAREQLAINLVKILKFLLFGTAIVVIVQGTGWLSFNLTDTAIGTFFGAFTASFIGLIVIILKYFYSERSSRSLEVIKDFIVKMCAYNSQYHDKDKTTDTQLS